MVHEDYKINLPYTYFLKQYLTEVQGLQLNEISIEKFLQLWNKNHQNNFIKILSIYLTFGTFKYAFPPICLNLFNEEQNWNKESMSTKFINFPFEFF